MTDTRKFRIATYLLVSLDGLKSVGGIIAGGSALGGFISDQFGTLAGLLGIAFGLGVQQVCAFGITMLKSEKGNSTSGGGI